MLNVTYAAPPYLVRAAAGSPHGITDQVTISSTTKFGVTGFAETLRQELLSRQVRVSVIGSGTADTELTTYLREEYGRPCSARRNRPSRCCQRRLPTLSPAS